MSKTLNCRVFSILAFSFFSAIAVIPSFAGPSRETGSTDTQSRELAHTGLVEEVRSLSETGRLSSMLEALELIRSRDIGGTEFGRIVSGINTLMIRLVYPDSPAVLPVIDLPLTHNYTRIIREAERGLYTRPPADSTDFFEHILPFLAVNDQTEQRIFSDILRDLSKAGELRPNSVFPSFFQGIIHERMSRYNQAEASFRRAYEISNECYPALIGIARIKRLSGNTAEAAAIFSDLTVRYPDSMEIKHQLAHTWFENRDWNKALTMIDDILISEPRNEDFLLMRAYIMIEQGQFSQANSSLDVYASINTTNRNYLFYRARVQAEGNRNRDSAVNYLRSILRTDNSDAEVMQYAAALLMESQRPADLQESSQLLERLRGISGSSVDILNLSLNDAVRREAWQEAQGYLNRILSTRRTAADLVNAYYVERGLGNNTRALTFARELFGLDSANNEYAVIYISALIDNGRRQEASSLLENRLNLSISPNIKSQMYFLRSRIQANEETALSDLRSSIFEDPRNLEALISMFEIYHRRREERRAVYYLRQALSIAPDNARLKRFETEYAALLGRN